MRSLSGSTRIAVAAWAALAALFHLHVAIAGFIEPRQMRSLHLLFLLPLAFLLWPARPGVSPAHRPSLPDLALAVLSTIPSLHSFVGASAIDLHLEDAASMAGEALWPGGLASLLVVEALRRAVSPVLAGLLAAGILYLLASVAVPGLLHSRDMPLHHIAAAMYRLDGMGVHGVVAGISATMIATFIVLGTAIEKSGVRRLLDGLGTCVAGRQDGGAAKAGIVSSALSGMTSGTIAARALATRPLAAPAKNAQGFHPHFAAGVEASSSAGLQVMPPVMGAGAFVLAGLSGVPYGQACLAAVSGALLHVLALLANVHFEAKRLRLPGIPGSDAPRWGDVLRDAPLLLPVALLVVLLFLGWAPHLAAFWAIVATFLVSWVHRHPRTILLVLPVAIAVSLALLRFGEHGGAWSFAIALGAAALLAMLWSRPGTRPLVREAFDVLASAGCRMAVVALACVGAGMFVACLAATGLLASAWGAMVPMGHGSMLAAGALLLVATLVLGMAVPAVAAFVIGACVGARILVDLGVPVLAAHMSVFHVSTLAAAIILPPSPSAPSIFRAGTMRPWLVAARLSLAALVVGFNTLHAPALLMQGPWPGIVAELLANAAGLALAAAAFSGYFRGDLADAWRIVIGAAAIVLLLLLPGVDAWTRLACEAVIWAALVLAPRAFAPDEAVLAARLAGRRREG